MLIQRLLPIVALTFGIAFAAQAADTTVRVISDRTPSHLEPLFEYYRTLTGVEIESAFVDKGLIARLQSRPTEADLIITKTADILEEAKQQRLLRPFDSSTIAAELPARFRDADDAYITLSYRPRVIFASKERVEPDSIETYADLTDPEWRGRICIRSGYHNYNLSLLSQMAEDQGLPAARAFIMGLHANLARRPKGNDRAQVRAIYEGECDLSLGNSYYMPIMLANPEQRAWGKATYLIFPNQESGGSYIMRGGAALTTANRNVPAATQLLEFLVSNAGQEFIVNTTFEYPVRDDVEMLDSLRALGNRQEGIEGGRFKANFIPLDAIAAHRDAIVTILDEVDFDSDR
ncbi:ABC transporter substrate-binding protein [Halochromatium glycolicum]|nr:ABC transporter substrate-binding protein [Halochromatium glycolicum]